MIESKTMDKIRFTKDARYYRNLLYKTELRHSILTKDLRKLKNEQVLLSLRNQKQITQLQNTQKMLMLLFFFYAIKDLIIMYKYHDYTSTLLYLRENYWEYVRPLFESYSKWQNGMRSFGFFTIEEVLL